MIPSLLPEKQPTNELNRLWYSKNSYNELFSDDNQPKGEEVDKKQIYRYGRIWKFTFIPIGIFSRIIVRLLHFDELAILLIWKNGIVVRYKNQYGLLLFQPETRSIVMEIRTTKIGLPILMSHILQSIDTLLDTFYSIRIDQRQILIPCIHCWSRCYDNKNPFLFSIEDLILSLSRGNPFSYCNGISSRKVRIDLLAPDLAFGGLPTISSDAVTFDKQIAKGFLPSFLPIFILFSAFATTKNSYYFSSYQFHNYEWYWDLPPEVPGPIFHCHFFTNSSVPLFSS